jgi:hypothetical protein
MKVKYKTVDGRFEVEIEGAKLQDVLQEVSSAEEILGQGTCEACGAPARFSVRDVDYPNKDNPKKTDHTTYYEAVCTNRKCGCALTFGTRQDNGKLFPRRHRKGNYFENNGWVKQPKAGGRDLGKTEDKDDGTPF